MEIVTACDSYELHVVDSFSINFQRCSIDLKSPILRIQLWSLISNQGEFLLLSNISLHKLEPTSARDN